MVDATAKADLNRRLRLKLFSQTYTNHHAANRSLVFPNMKMLVRVRPRSPI